MQTPYSLVVIEDDPDIRRLLEILVDRDHRIVLAQSFDNADDALLALRAHRPDVILCDVRLPGMSGLEAVPLFRDACPDTVVVLYTADPDRAHGAVALGADSVVGKDTGPIRLFGQIVELREQRAYS